MSAGRQTDREENRKISRQEGRQTERQINIHEGRKADIGKTVRQI